MLQIEMNAQANPLNLNLQHLVGGFTPTCYRLRRFDSGILICASYRVALTRWFPQ